MSSDSRLRELEERVNELEERQREQQPVTLSRRALLGLMTALGLGAITTTTATAQTPSETAAQNYCTLRAPTGERPEATPDCRWLHFEGDEGVDVDRQIILYSEDGEWHLFDPVPKREYGRVYPDHPDYSSIDDALTHQTQTSTPPSIAVLGDADYGDVTMPDASALQGAGFESNINALTMDSAGNDIAFFIQATDTVEMHEFCMIETSYLTNGNDINMQEQASSILNNIMLTNSVTVSGNACNVIGNRNATSFTSFSVTLSADNCTVTNNTRASVTDNGTGNQVANNT